MYCFGDHDAALFFSYKDNDWKEIRYTSDSEYHGNLKYMAGCFVPTHNAVILSGMLYCGFNLVGGCDVASGEPAVDAFVATFETVNALKRISPLLVARFGHAAIWMNHEVYAMGGYANKDDESA